MPIEQIQLPDGCPSLEGYYAYLTGGCNLACQHCWLSPTFQPNGDTGGHLDYDLFALAIDQGLPLGLNTIKLTGGEPLLHPDFIRIVDLVKEKGLSLNIETNGTLLTRSLARYLKEKSSLFSIAVSLDGATPETHDAFRGVEGSFDKTCQAIRYLAEQDYQPQVIMSIHPGNVGEMEALVHLVMELGAGSVKFNLVQPTGRGQLMSKRDKVLDVRRLIELGGWVEDLQKRTSIYLSYSWPLAFHRLRYLYTRPNHTMCNIFGILGILPTGHLALCGIGVHESELVYGQIGKDDLFTVWSTHPMLLDLRQKLPSQLEGICQVCFMRDRCLGLCAASNYQREGRLTSAYWFCQEAEAAGLFPASRRA